MAFFEKNESFSKITFADFFLQKSKTIRYELKDVDELRVYGSSITAEDLSRMAVVQHLICTNCTIATLQPLLQSPLKKLTLISCKITTPGETGASFANLESLTILCVKVIRNTWYEDLLITIPLSLKHLDFDQYDCDKRILANVTDTLHIRTSVPNTLFEWVRAKTLIVPDLEYPGIELAAHVKCLVCRGPISKSIRLPSIEKLIIQTKYFDPTQFPNLREVYLNHAEKPIDLADALPYLRVIGFYGRFPCTTLDRPGIKIVQYQKPINHLDL